MQRFSSYFKSAITAGMIALLVVFGCSNDSSTNNDGDFSNDLRDQYASVNWDTVFTDSFADDSNDLEAMPVDQAGPPYSGPVDYPAVDVTMIKLGVKGNYLYMRADYFGTIPSAKVHITASGEIETQDVTNQGMNISLNVDNNISTGSNGEGVSGVEIFFAIGFDYGRSYNIYANYDFPDGDIHHNQQQVLGHLVGGGPGTKYAIGRWDISGLGDFFPRGSLVEFASWSEAESYNADGSLKYHHYAFDGMSAVNWTIPE